MAVDVIMMLQRKRMLPVLALVWVAVGLQCLECQSRPVLFSTQDSTRAAATEGSASKPSVSITEKNSTKFDAMESSQSQLSEVNAFASNISMKFPKLAASSDEENVIKYRKTDEGDSVLNVSKPLPVSDESVSKSTKSKLSGQPKRLARDALRKEARKKRSSQVKKTAPADGALSLEIVEEDPRHRDLNSKQPNTPRKKKRTVIKEEKSANKVGRDIPEQKGETSSKVLRKKKLTTAPTKNQNIRNNESNKDKSIKPTMKVVKKRSAVIEQVEISADTYDNEGTQTEENGQNHEDEQAEDEVDSSTALTRGQKEIEVVEETGKEEEEEEEEQEEDEEEGGIDNSVNEGEKYEHYETVAGESKGEQSTENEDVAEEYEYEDEATTQEENTDSVLKEEDNQAHPADVEASPANETTRFSNNRPRSTDVTPKQTNEKPLLMENSSDVPRSLGGVGGKSMNEKLQAMLGPGHPPKVSIIGKCNLKDFTLKMECRGNLISICTGNAQAHSVKVWIEGGEGYAEITNQAPTVFAQLRADNHTAAPRWKVSQAVEESAVSSECPNPVLHSPVLIVQAANSACRVLVDCTCRKDEAFTSLAEDGDGRDKCDDEPLLYAGISLNRGDGTRILEGSPVNLGDTIQLRVEAEVALGGSTLSQKLAQRRGQGTQDARLDLHLSKCWVGRPGHERALLVQDGCSMVDILKNFAERSEKAAKILQVYDSYIINARKKILKQSRQKRTIEHETLKENEILETHLESRHLTGRVVQSASLVAFIMDMADKTIDITCQVKICVDECLESPTCVDSSVNVDRGLRVRVPPVYSVVRSLTVSMTPNLNASGTTSPQEKIRKERSISSPEIDSSSPNFGGKDVEQLTNRKSTSDSSISDAPVQEAQAGGFFLGKAEDGNASGSNGSRDSPWISYSDPNLVDPHAESGNCVPWWLFFLSLAVLTITYIIALIACVYYLSNEPQKLGARSQDAVYTPTRPYYIDQCSARKRSPPSFTERYLY